MLSLAWKEPGLFRVANLKMDWRKMSEIVKQLSKVRNVVSRELKKLPKSESSESQRYALNFILEHIEIMIQLLELIE